MKRAELLKKRQAMLKEQICDNLELLIGSVGSSPAMKYYNLTTKVNGKTVTRYLRQSLVPKVKKMTQRHRKVKASIAKLSKVNWELLKIESQ